jgi:maleylpyruvate isomerase
VRFTPRRPAARHVNSHGYRLWLGGPLPPGADAMALGRTVIVRKDMVGKTSLDHLLRHELTHVEQWRTLGVVGFARVYLGEYFAGRRRGLNHRDAYLAISLEQEARQRADAFALPGPVIQTPDVAAAHRRSEALLNQFDDESLRLPSRLAGWTVGHVIAHLTLSAEAFVHSINDNNSPSRTHHDKEFASLAASPKRVLVDRFTQSNRAFETALDQQSPVDSHVVSGRLREVEVHAADLGHRRYTAQSWSDRFVDVAIAELVPAAHRRVDRPLHLIDERGLHHFIGEATQVPALRVTRRSLVSWLLSREQPSHLPQLDHWESPR